MSYHGEGNSGNDPACTNTDRMSECGLAFDCKCQDSKNNTYNCVRTLYSEENSIYCQFQDSVNFMEMYDLNKDPQQLYNLANFMTDDEKQVYDSKLEKLKKCKGAVNCKFACKK